MYGVAEVIRKLKPNVNCIKIFYVSVSYYVYKVRRIHFSLLQYHMYRKSTYQSQCLPFLNFPSFSYKTHTQEYFHHSLMVCLHIVRLYALSKSKLLPVDCIYL